MTLLAKTTLFYLLVAFLVFGLGGVVTYNMIRQEVQNETDYYLNETFGLLVKAIEDGKPPRAFVNDKVLICELEDRLWTDTLPHFSDTLGTHLTLDRLEPHRKRRQIKKINGRYYQITLTDVLIESDDMYEGVVDILSQLFLFLSLALIAFSFLFARLLLAPFKETLRRIRRFNLKSQESFVLPRTTTREFKVLNGFIEGMTSKAKRDYLSLKEFNENASHEMQTPIAIAKGKLELLLETEEDLTDRQVGLIQSAHHAIGRLSRIGQSLSLLNKIDNQEFTAREKTDFSSTVHSSILYFKELAELKGLRIGSQLVDEIELPIDGMLAEILLSNLLRNAIQHNEPKGWIEVTLTADKLEVSNTGRPPQLSTDRLFERFRKGNYEGGSVGLGLAIVKKICDVNKWEIDYLYSEGVHRIAVSFGDVLAEV